MKMTYVLERVRKNDRNHEIIGVYDIQTVSMAYEVILDCLQLYGEEMVRSTQNAVCKIYETTGAFYKIHTIPYHEIDDIT